MPKSNTSKWFRKLCVIGTSICVLMWEIMWCSGIFNNIFHKTYGFVTNAIATVGENRLIGSEESQQADSVKYQSKSYWKFEKSCKY